MGGRKTTSDAPRRDAGLYRANLHYAVRQVGGEEDKRAALLELLGAMHGAGIVYAATVNAAEALESFLRESGADPLLYHGRLPARLREERRDAFVREPARLVVATDAFGIGIDKHDVRFVVHYQLPGSLEAYHRQSGRAGGDGEPARCTLLYDPADRRVHRGRLERDREGLERMSFYALGAHCRWKMLLEYFGAGAGFVACGTCDNCLRPLRAQPATPRRLRKGEAVEVPRYGRGIVVSAAPDRIVVSFPDGKTREFLPAYVTRPASRSS